MKAGNIRCLLYKVLFSPHCRTARGDNDGTALSFVTANDYKMLKKAEEELTKEFIGTDIYYLFDVKLRREVYLSDKVIDDVMVM